MGGKNEKKRVASPVKGNVFGDILFGLLDNKALIKWDKLLKYLLSVKQFFLVTVDPMFKERTCPHEINPHLQELIPI